MDDFEWDEKEIHDTVVYTVLEAHFTRLFERTNRRSTRTSLLVMDEVLRSTKLVRLNRLMTESHLTNTLLSDCKRTLRELRYTITLQTFIRF